MMSNKLDKLNYTHFLYVRKYSIITNDYEMYVYGVRTNDIFHTMGEIIYRSLEHIDRITFAEITEDNIESKLNFFSECNLKIYEWYDKYNND